MRNSAEERVRKQLQQIDGLLDIKYYPMIKRHALVVHWPSNDPRRELFQRGEFDDDVDILGWYTVDMHDADTPAVDIEMLEQRVIELLGKADNQRIDWKRRLQQIVEKNAKLRRERKQEVIDRAEQVAKDLIYMSGHNEESTMTRIMQQAKEEYND